nr:phosphoribosyltransferase [Nitrosopumilaceae archaeon]NIU88038.1 phosphoribosyltransferase [Nitrosopumilaceae archaeon]NIV66305.1 phosphoribosyltransferase [Nitrosopumilaceae archaeon]NIX62221.1 phosphoribosyltransferase [Nitrosopumilaceae archaeon]
VSKKITPPGHPEFAIGAITHDGTLFKGEHWDQFSNHPDFVQELSKKKEEVKRRIEEYRGSSEYNLENKTIILVDDGIATGSTVYAILFWLKKQKPRKIILAVPVVPEESFKIMRSHVSRLVVLLTPTEFSAVGQFYQTFEQVSDKKVKEIISKHLL